MLIAMLGFHQQKWPSVERTRLFYQRALSDEFQLRICANEQEIATGPVPDAVLNFTGSTGWALQSRPECPTLFALHGGPVLDFEFLAQQMQRLRDTDVFIVNCRSDEAILRSLAQSEAVRVSRLPLPVDVKVFHPQYKASCRSVLPATSDYLIGFVARLLPQKNLHGFLNILADVKAKLSPKTVHGLVIGNYWLDYPILPYCTDRYPALIEHAVNNLDLQNDVTFLPASLTDEQLACCYAGMDLLVHPTYAIDENFGYAPVEAMACGTPVVGSAYGGLKDTVLHGTTGYLIPTWVTPTGIRMDTLSAANAVVRLLERESLRCQMSAAAATHALNTFSEAACSLILRRAVRDAITVRGAVPMKPSPPLPTSISESPGELPESSPPWEQYVRPISHYVSRRPPKASECTRFCLAGRIRIDRGGIITLEDPAWPARYRLEEVDQRLVEFVAERGTIAAGMFPAAFTLKSAAFLASRLQRLIDAGLLIGSVES